MPGRQNLKNLNNFNSYLRYISFQMGGRKIIEGIGKSIYLFLFYEDSLDRFLKFVERDIKVMSSPEKSFDIVYDQELTV